MRKPPRYWNYDTCYSEAKKYKNRNAFKHGCMSAYGVARRNGWMKDYSWLKPQLEVWSFEKCYEIAKGCATKADFEKANPAACQAAYRNGWMKQYDWLLDGRLYDSNGKRKDKSKREPNSALESKKKTHCIYVYEFKDHAVYVGLTMIRRIKGRDYEHIFGEDTVSKYALDNNFSIPHMKVVLSNLTPLEARIKEGEVLAEYESNGWKIVNRAKTGGLGACMYGYWTKERCIEEGKKYKTIKEYQTKSQSSYNAARVNGWLYEFDWFEQVKHPSGYWDYNHCLEEAKKYNVFSDFRTYSQRAYQVARDNGWIKEYTWLKRVSLPNGHWDVYENCYQEAKKYDSRISFFHGNKTAYLSASTHKWLDDYSWFKYKKQKPKGYWNYENCYQEAKKYKSRTEFARNCNRGYQISLTNGWIKDYTWFKNNNISAQLNLFEQENDY